MSDRLFLGILCLLVSLSGFGQKQVVGAVGFYNVENLFDTFHDEGKNDEEYTPGGEKKWDQEKYKDKQNKIARVLSTMANGADIIGLSEVEKLAVLNDLVAHPDLKKFNYQIIHKESPDRRGIDCALLYKPNRFKVLNYKTYDFPGDYVSRDVLHVSGLYFGDTLHVMVNHWPSRFGGKADKRQAVAAQVRGKVDSLLSKNADAKIIIMGDLNDDPINKSVKKVLNATGKENLKEGQLFNASAKSFASGVGTLYYRGAWNLFDQIIVSNSLLSTSTGVTMIKNSFSIFGPDWMRQKTGNYAGAPLRSYVSNVYQYGYSDHFPTYILLEK